MNYYLGPWEWSNEQGGYWHAPAGTVGLLDLRPLPCDQPNYGFFATKKPLTDPPYVNLGTDFDAKLSSSIRAALAAALKIPSLDGNSLRELLPEILTTKADPTGKDRALPLIPKQDGMLEIVLGQHGVIWEREFEGESDPAWPNIQAVLQEAYRRVKQQADVDGTETHRRLLGSWVEKYGMDESKFIPDDLAPEKALSPETTVTDNFNRANQNLDAGPWIEDTGVWTVDTNEVKEADVVASQPRARHTTSLSSDDHYAQVDLTSRDTPIGFVAPNCRMEVAATLYRCVIYGATLYLQKLITGGITNMDNAAISVSLPDTARVQADGSSIKGFFNGAETVSATDSAISGNLEIGISGRGDSNAATGDNFEAADLYKRLSGSITAASTASAALTKYRQLAGSLAASSSVAAAAMGRMRGLIGSSTGASAASAAISREREIAGTIASASTASAGVTKYRELTGSIASISTALASITKYRQLTGSVTGASNVPAALMLRIKYLAGAITGVSTVSAAELLSFPSPNIWDPGWFEIPIGVITGVPGYGAGAWGTSSYGSVGTITTGLPDTDWDLLTGEEVEWSEQEATDPAWAVIE